MVNFKALICVTFEHKIYINGRLNGAFLVVEKKLFQCTIAPQCIIFLPRIVVKCAIAPLKEQKSHVLKKRTNAPLHRGAFDFKRRSMH